MIRQLTIERFKSIKSLSIPCKKVNVFIGAPDTGKTNILEVFCLLSRLAFLWPLDTSLRIRPDMGFDALFYRQFFDSPIVTGMRLEPGYFGAHLGDEFSMTATIGGGGQSLNLQFTGPFSWSGSVQYGGNVHLPPLDWIRFYSYSRSEDWQYVSHGHRGDKLVNPPYGYNLLYIARHNSRIYEFLKELVAGLNWRIKFDQGQKTFRLSEVRADEIVDYNLDLLSDSLKRLFFYGAILKTSENAVLVLDEPDVFAFPPYPKTLGEMIGADRSNQFFLTTHNPYFLTGIVEKTPIVDLAVFVCHRGPDGSTAARLLSPDDISKVLDLGASVFFNLADFLA